MTEKEKIWLASLSVGTLGLATLIILYRKEIKSGVMSGLSSFKKSILSIANNEWNEWNPNNQRIKEGDSRTMDKLRSYWREGANLNWSDQKMIDEAWSSAFISWVMNKGGAEGEFPKTASHSKYIRASVKNRKENNSNPFKAYKVNEPEAKVKVGDLVCYPRQSNVSYDTLSAYKSHCDIVTEIKGNEAVTIGGNVGNSVTKTIVPIDSKGYIDKTRDKKGYGGYFTVIKNNK